MTTKFPLATLALATLLATPAVQAQTRRTPPRAATTTTTDVDQTLRVGGLVGFEWGDFDGFALRADGELPFRRLAPNVTLSGVGSVGLSFLGEDVGAGVDADFTIFEVLPAARATLEVDPQLSVYADAGIGLYYASLSFDPEVFDDDSSVGITTRFGAGGFYAVNEQLRIGAEAAIHPRFGDLDDTTFTLMAGAQFALR
jgi:opacity protein-like surface antigen